MFKAIPLIAFLFFPYSNHGSFGREMDRRKLILGHGSTNGERGANQAKSNDIEEGLHA